MVNCGASPGITDEERRWLAAVEEEWSSTTTGEWYAHVTDDALFMNARYVSVVPGELHLGFVMDKGTGMAAGSKDQADHKKVVAVTLLHSSSRRKVTRTRYSLRMSTSTFLAY
jgi:hypothetical protein